MRGSCGTRAPNPVRTLRGRREAPRRPCAFLPKRPGHEGEAAGGATMVAVLRAAVLSVALAVLAAACGVVPHPGSREIQARVWNHSAVPVELTVETPGGVMQGAARPASLPPGEGGTVTFFLPPGDEYWIMVNATMVPGSGVDERCSSLLVRVSPTGAGAISCIDR